MNYKIEKCIEAASYIKYKATDSRGNIYYYYCGNDFLTTGIVVVNEDGKRIFDSRIVNRILDAIKEVKA